MNEFLAVAQAEGVEFTFDVIFHGLYIVVCCHLNVFHLLCFCNGEVCRVVDSAQSVFLLLRELRELGQAHVGEGDEILDFYFYAVADCCVFREIFCEGFAFGTVASVNGRDGGE